jgi:Ca2+-binding EF-hand superfamily protein
MKAFSKLIVAGCLVCAAPLVQACEGKPCDPKHGAAGWYFSEMDKNGDGAVSRKEFDAFHAARFKELDANHDGKITQDEIDAAHRRMAERGKARFYQRFEESDINHDGALSKDEAEIGMPMVFAHFEEFDANKDGKITKDELVEGMKKLHEQVQQRRGEKMMPSGQK